ncbi:MAG: 50S ribosome-binding GTPase [Gemmataceae bacterium]|jgi:small GTP-binding protein|nr:50S ribosome-binding GTPase [Gemmataceae bacterium]
MAVNLPPQYHDAEAEYKKAQTPEAKLVALRKMWVILPKHKASEKVQSQLKTKISELTDEIEVAQSTVKKSPTSIKIPRQGAGQIVLVGSPNSGRSSLLRKLTKATPEVALYPFTTREPVPGMMDFEDVRVQLIELPPITADFYENYVTDFTRGADGVALVVDMGDDDGPFAAEVVIDQLKKRRRILVDQLPEVDEDPSVYHIKTVVVANKMDVEGAKERLEIFKEMMGNRFRIIEVSAETGQGLDQLKAELYRLLGVIRIYSKLPGKPADMTAPFTIPIGGTVLDFAEKVHSELAENLKSAKVWGSARFDGMSVTKDHVLQDKDIVELS